MSAGYAELHCLSNFSFQRGASSAGELFERAKRHGYAALAITDECTLAGIVRAWQASKKAGLPLVVGSEMRVEGGPKLVLLAEDLAGYQALCRIITAARMRAKGRVPAAAKTSGRASRGCWAVGAGRSAVTEKRTGCGAVPDRLDRGGLHAARRRGEADPAAGAGRAPRPAAGTAGDVHMHARRRALRT